MDTLHVASTYSYLTDWLATLPQRFNYEGTTIYHKRNCIKVFEVNGVVLNVKQYCVPNFINRWVYALLRKPKAVRAYHNAERLALLGIVTPTPVAFLLQHQMGGLRTSYLITIQMPLSRDFYEFGHGTLDGRETIVAAMATMAAEMHEKGVMHKDFSPGNILFDVDNEGIPHFAIVDINRMRFGTVNIEQGCRSFARLWGKEDFFRIVAHHYAKARHADENNCLRLILAARKRFWKNRHISYEYE
ncbi:MAG: lipopolysaccharide kinase InaA family protein [Bacteroidales bacterium]|nr:lipopolysaccharide kinase InaA family protein [Bacteroidales bacterium]